MILDVPRYLKERAAAVDEALERLLPAETDPPQTIHKAMRYSVFAGGKRLRPVLVIAGAEAVGGTMERVMPTACAMELIHTYSLVHDDLPAMDNDDFRRGVPTSHKVFGEAMAILAGDALLTLAFGLIAENFAAEGAASGLRQVVADVAEAAGTRGMVGGQVADIEAEGRQVTAEALDFIHLHKTAALIRTSLRIGAVISGGHARPGAGALGRGRRARPGVPDRGRPARRGGHHRAARQDRGQGPGAAEGDLSRRPRSLRVARARPGLDRRGGGRPPAARPARRAHPRPRPVHPRAQGLMVHIERTA